MFNEDFWEEQSAFSSLCKEIDNKIVEQQSRILEGDCMVQRTQSVDNHDAWMNASDGTAMRKKAEDEIHVLERLRTEPYQARFDLSIEENRKAKDYRLYLGRRYYKCDDGRIIINWADDSTPQKRRLLEAYRSSKNQLESDQYSYNVSC